METAIVEGSPSEDGRPVVYLLQDVHHASIDSHRFCRNLFANGPCLRTLPFVWSMTHRIFDGHFLFKNTNYENANSSIFYILVSGMHRLKN